MSRLRRELQTEDEGVSFTDAPSEKESSRLTSMANELVSERRAVEALEAEIKKKNERIRQLEFVDLPAYMKQIGQDIVGLPDQDADIRLEAFYHANIKADWPEEQREAAFAWLEKHGHADLIKTTVSFTFPRRALEKARWLVAMTGLLRDKLLEQGAEFPEATTKMEIPWNTLTAWLREQTESSKSVPLEIIGGEVGTIAKIKERKTDGKGRKRKA